MRLTGRKSRTRRGTTAATSVSVSRWPRRLACASCGSGRTRTWSAARSISAGCDDSEAAFQPVACSLQPDIADWIVMRSFIHDRHGRRKHWSRGGARNDDGAAPSTMTQLRATTTQPRAPMTHPLPSDLPAAVTRSQIC